MINIKPTMVNALENNTQLTTLLNGPKIFFQLAPQGTEAPYTTYFEVTNFDSEFADDEPIASDILMQVSIFSLESTSEIAGEVDKTMKEIGFRRTSSVDLYEEDTKLYHKAMRYSITKEI